MVIFPAFGYNRNDDVWKESETMKNRRLIRFAILGTMILCFMVFTIIVLFPMLEKALYVEKVPEVQLPKEEETAKAKEAEELLMTAIYERGEEGKIAAIYIEVFHTRTGNAYYMEVPVNTKVTLSAELYKKLQAYSPELPQYLKLENMGVGFSEEYCMTGCNRILSEVLGVNMIHYVASDSKGLTDWSDGLHRLILEEEPPAEFLATYREWLEVSESDLTPADRWIYYEKYEKIIPHAPEPAPGEEGLGEYLVFAPEAKARLYELKRLAQISAE